MTYQQEFTAEVIEFADLNRLNIARLNRDVHANCYIPVTIATIILSDGSVKDVSIVKSSTEVVYGARRRQIFPVHHRAGVTLSATRESL
jgi:hypothetical protein